jgi:hypothetical protein
VVNVLNGVTCVSDSDCWAVGNHSPGIPVGVGASPEQTLAMHWDGSAWTIVATPTPTNNYDILLGVSCASSTDCMAVGFFPVGVIYRTLAEHWDGSAWTIVSTPNVNSDQDNVLNGVACRPGVGCWAAGYYNAGDISSPMQQTLIEHWDGSAWIIAPSPNSSITLRNYLYAVTCSSAAECWTTGNWDTATGADTLIERYTAPVLELRSIARLNDGRIVLSGIANANLTVLAADAPDPAGFEAIGTATRNDTGGFVFEDVDAIGRDRRFYRLGFQ